jgi:hypothetical protein
MNTDGLELERLKRELNKGLLEFAQTGSELLEEKRKIVDEKIKSVIENYTAEIKNLALISGTVAPFSLTLLNVDRLQVSVPLLIYGFALLITNIIFSQFCLHRNLKNNDTKVVKAQIKGLFADLSLSELKNETKEGTDRVLKMYEYRENISEMDKLLGLKTLDINLIAIVKAFRVYGTWMNFLFLVGAVSIILSVLVDYARYFF